MCLNLRPKFQSDRIFVRLSGVGGYKTKFISITFLAAVAVAYVNCDGFNSSVLPQTITQRDPPVIVPPDPPPPPPPPPPAKLFLYVASQAVPFIDVYSINNTTGKLTKTSSVNLPGEVMPILPHPNKKVLYAGLTGRRSVASYAVDQTTAALTFQKEVGVNLNPVYLGIDGVAKNLLVPSYADSAISILPIDGAGVLANQISDKKNTGPNSHSAISMNGGSLVFVSNTVGGTISQFVFDTSLGILAANPLEAQIQAPAGPRHLMNHPKLDTLLYAVNEVGDSVTLYNLNKATGRLSAVQTISTLPQGVNGSNNTCADIQITPDGKFLYASNRTENGQLSTLAIYAAAGDGRLTLAGHQTVSGTPREFEIDPSGKFVYVGGLVTNKLGAYLINQTTGLLTLIEELNFNSPIWLYGLSL
jgi:6-phosphogluconolactonase